MSKRGRKRKDRRKGKANHGKRPNSYPAPPVRRGAETTVMVPAPLLLCPHEHPVSSAVL